MVSVLDSGASGPGSSPCWGHCVVFLGKTLYSHTVPLSTQVYKRVPVKCWGKPNKLRGSDLRWTSIQGKKRYFYPLHATETGISSASYEPVLAPRLHLLTICRFYSHNQKNSRSYYQFLIRYKPVYCTYENER